MFSFLPHSFRLAFLCSWRELLFLLLLGLFVIWRTMTGAVTSQDHYLAQHDLLVASLFAGLFVFHLMYSSAVNGRKFIILKMYSHTYLAWIRYKFSSAMIALVGAWIFLLLLSIFVIVDHQPYFKVKPIVPQVKEGAYEWEMPPYSDTLWMNASLVDSKGMLAQMNAPTLFVVKGKTKFFPLFTKRWSRIQMDANDAGTINLPIQQGSSSASYNVLLSGLVIEGKVASTFNVINHAMTAYRLILMFFILLTILAYDWLPQASAKILIHGGWFFLFAFSFFQPFDKQLGVGDQQVYWWESVLNAYASGMEPFLRGMASLLRPFSTHAMDQGLLLPESVGGVAFGVQWILWGMSVLILLLPRSRD